MFILEISGDTNFTLVLLTVLVCLMINYINKIDNFTNRDGDRSNGFETIFGYLANYDPAT